MHTVIARFHHDNRDLAALEDDLRRLVDGIVAAAA